LGKLKMWLQCGALVAIFLFLWPGLSWLEPVRDVLIYVMAVVTVLSGLQYLWKGYRLVGKSGPSA
jgi:phosphatidylglycerophosphate synthase